jgi:acyl carrier protein
MQAIFADSLARHSNVCQGCFKTIYTLGLKEARERGIRYIVTGLSRGQFFETRLTEELFASDRVDVEAIDEAILEARKTYHRADDAVTRSVGTGLFRDDTIFEEVQFVDFYRYCDVGLDEMMAYLAERVPWVRPADTGRSTNCLINDVGIYVHKKERGYHNYALPYSWDVRMGHKTRDAALDELDDDIDPASVARILDEVGYAMPEAGPGPGRARLVAYYVAGQKLNTSALGTSALRTHLAQKLPDALVPAAFVRLDALPMTPNGKVDRAALPAPDAQRPDLEVPFEAPASPTEVQVAAIWSGVLKVQRIGRYDNFLDLGGNSLLAIQVVSRMSQAFQIDVPLRSAFEAPTVATSAALVEDLLLAEI